MKRLSNSIIIVFGRFQTKVAIKVQDREEARYHQGRFLRFLIYYIKVMLRIIHGILVLLELK